MTIEGVTLEIGHWYDIREVGSKATYRGMRFTGAQWGRRWSTYGKGATFDKWGAKDPRLAKPVTFSPLSASASSRRSTRRRSSASWRRRWKSATASTRRQREAARLERASR